MASIEIRPAGRRRRTFTGFFVLAALVPAFGAGCGSQEAPPPSASSALTTGSCTVSGDGSAPTVLTFAPDARAKLVTSSRTESDGAETLLVEYDLDQKKRLSIQTTVHGDTMDVLEDFEAAAMSAQKPVKVTLHRAADKTVTGSVNGHTIVPFNMGAIGPGFVPKLADNTALPKVIDDVQKEFVLAMTAFGQSGNGQGGTTCSFGGGAPQSASLHPAWMPGSPDGPGPSCDDCHESCGYVLAGCTATALLACVGLVSIPIVGGALVLVCAGIGALACYAGSQACMGACNNIGSGCCPVACGAGCCGASETCLDTGQSLCCRAGFMPCIGPHEVCYDPHTEICRPDGSACALTDVCGTACCGAGSHCFDAASSSCCADTQRCGSACCGIGQQCVTTPGAGQTCCPSERACGSVCCGEGQFCDTSTHTCAAVTKCPTGSFACLGTSTSICCTPPQGCANRLDGTPICTF